MPIPRCPYPQLSYPSPLPPPTPAGKVNNRVNFTRRPCVHGNCVDRRANWYCECPAKYGGKNCSVELIGCNQEVTCLNNGTCKPYLLDETQHKFNCTCPNGFQGATCEKVRNRELRVVVKPEIFRQEMKKYRFACLLFFLADHNNVVKRRIPHHSQYDQRRRLRYIVPFQNHLTERFPGLRKRIHVLLPAAAERTPKFAFESAE